MWKLQELRRCQNIFRLNQFNIITEGKSNAHTEVKKYLPFNTWTFVSGDRDPWTDWSECQADCTSNKTVKGTMTRSRKITLDGKYLEDEVQVVDCDNPCPLGI